MVACSLFGDYRHFRGTSLRAPLHDEHETFLRCSPALLDGLPKLEILSRLHAADGNELADKFLSNRSSSALVANVFGIFYLNPEHFTLPADLALRDLPTSLLLEERLRFPWAGGRHPNLDVVVVTNSEVLAVECKRLEPFDRRKAPKFSDAYFRKKWGERMRAFENVRDLLQNGTYLPQHLDAVQLVKHAFGLRTQANRVGKRARLLYVYIDALPASVASTEAQSLHRAEVAEFAHLVEGDEVAFGAISYRSLLTHWEMTGNSVICEHVRAVKLHFGI